MNRNANQLCANLTQFKAKNKIHAQCIHRVQHYASKPGLTTAVKMEWESCPLTLPYSHIVQKKLAEASKAFEPDSGGTQGREASSGSLLADSRRQAVRVDKVERRLHNRFGKAIQGTPRASAYLPLSCRTAQPQQRQMHSELEHGV